MEQIKNVSFLNDSALALVRRMQLLTKKPCQAVTPKMHIDKESLCQVSKGFAKRCAGDRKWEEFPALICKRLPENAI